VNKHSELLLQMCETSGKTNVDLTIIGNSLGAGTASIAAMELHENDDMPQINVKAYGFGCLALVSLDLAEKADYITTIINDDDIVPRLSGATLANALMDVLEFDWLSYATCDIRTSLGIARRHHPNIFTEAVVEQILQVIEPRLETLLNDTVLRDSTKRARLEVESYPPGKCMHIYRDGVGFSGSHVPNMFFA
jgi:Lipase (class 3)